MVLGVGRSRRVNWVVVVVVECSNFFGRLRMVGACRNRLLGRLRR